MRGLPTSSEDIVRVDIDKLDLNKLFSLIDYAIDRYSGDLVFVEYLTVESAKVIDHLANEQFGCDISREVDLVSSCIQKNE